MLLASEVNDLCNYKKINKILKVTALSQENQIFRVFILELFVVRRRRQTSSTDVVINELIRRLVC